jgi:hypothetical protein
MEGTMQERLFDRPQRGREGGLLDHMNSLTT